MDYTATEESLFLWSLVCLKVKELPCPGCVPVPAPRVHSSAVFVLPWGIPGNPHSPCLPPPCVSSWVSHIPTQTCPSQCQQAVRGEFTAPGNVCSASLPVSTRARCVMSTQRGCTIWCLVPHPLPSTRSSPGKPALCAL